MSNPYTLIEQFITNEKPYVLKDMCILEFGFGDFGQLLDLYRLAPFRKYYGYEKFSEEELSITVKDGNGRAGAVVSNPCSIYDKYVGYCEIEEIENRLSEIEFGSTFSLSFEETIEGFLKSPRTNNLYDIGVFSKVFNKISDKSIPIKMVDWYFKNSNKQAFLLITVMTSKTYMVEGIDWIYSDEDLNELLEHFPGEIIGESNLNGNFVSVLKRKY